MATTATKSSGSKRLSSEISTSTSSQLDATPTSAKADGEKKVRIGSVAASEADSEIQGNGEGKEEKVEFKSTVSSTDSNRIDAQRAQVIKAELNEHLNRLYKASNIYRGKPDSQRTILGQDANANTEVDFLIPIGKDREHRLCGEYGEWSPPVTISGMTQLKNFLCKLYPQRANFTVLGRCYFSSETREQKLRQEIEIYETILDEVVDILLSDDKSLVAMFLGFIQYVSQEETATERISMRTDIPDYEFFCHVLGHAYETIPLAMMNRIVRTMVHLNTTRMDYDHLLDMLSEAFSENPYSLPEIDGDDDRNGPDQDKIFETKEKIYDKLLLAIDSEIKVLDIDIDVNQDYETKEAVVYDDEADEGDEVE